MQRWTSEEAKRIGCCTTAWDEAVQVSVPGGLKKVTPFWFLSFLSRYMHYARNFCLYIYHRH